MSPLESGFSKYISHIALPVIPSFAMGGSAPGGFYTDGDAQPPHTATGEIYKNGLHLLGYTGRAEMSIFNYTICNGPIQHINK